MGEHKSDAGSGLERHQDRNYPQCRAVPSCLVFEDSKGQTVRISRGAPFERKYVGPMGGGSGPRGLGPRTMAKMIGD